MNSTTSACVIGDLDLVRTVGMAGARVTLATTDERSPARASRFVERTAVIPDPDDDADGALRALLALGGAGRPALFYQGDADLLLVSRRRDQLAGRFRFVLPDAALVEATVDKLAFDALATRAALPVPQTAVLMPGGDVAASVAAWTRFPCVVKPALRAGWFASRLATRAGRARKALRLEDRAALDAIAVDVQGHDAPLLLQEHVAGDETAVVSFHAYVRADGDLVADATGRKIRTWARTCGMSTAVEITDDDEVRAAGRAVLRALSFRGVVKLDFKRDAGTGRLFLLEVNPRFNLWHWPAAIAGVNFPALVLADLVDAPRPRPRRARAGVRFVALREDVRAFREHRAAGEITTLGWLASAAGAHATRELWLRDPLPGLAIAAGVARDQLAAATSRCRTLFHAIHSANPLGLRLPWNANRGSKAPGRRSDRA